MVDEIDVIVLRFDSPICSSEGWGCSLLIFLNGVVLFRNDSGYGKLNAVGKNGSLVSSYGG